MCSKSMEFTRFGYVRVNPLITIGMCSKSMEFSKFTRLGTVRVNPLITMYVCTCMFCKSMGFKRLIGVHVCSRSM